MIALIVNHDGSCINLEVRGSVIHLVKSFIGYWLLIQEKGYTEPIYLKDGKSTDYGFCQDIDLYIFCDHVFHFFSRLKRACMPRRGNIVNERVISDKLFLRLLSRALSRRINDNPLYFKYILYLSRQYR